MQVGEHFVLGFRGAAVPDWLRDFSARFGLGGVILFDYDVQSQRYERNVFSPAQVAALCGELSSLPYPPLVLVDQEGGKVRRLKDRLGFAPLPSAEAFARLPRAEREELARASFGELARLGVHINLAPVIDLNLNPANPDIGAHQRSFSADADIVRENALLLGGAARQAGLALCLKHFPGIGGASTNSHDERTDLSASVTPAQEELFYELCPRMPGQAVLVSHGYVMPWDRERPACLSPAAGQRLRARLPQALLLTDDLQMRGLQQSFSTGQALPLALEAGMDLLLIGNNLRDEQEQAPQWAEELQRRIAQDEALARRHVEALERIAARKAQLLRSSKVSSAWAGPA